MEGLAMEIKDSSSNNSKASVAVSSSSKLSSKRLLFDRRYGWVFDEWKDPSEEALAGGRGMFCVVPLAKACLKTATVLINNVASSSAKVYERRDRLSLQSLQASINDQLHKVTSIIRKPELTWFGQNGNSPSHSSVHSSHSEIAKEDRQTD